jgi:hypothetical protein
VRRWFVPALAVALVALAIYPAFGTGYGVRAMLQMFMWIALAGSWNLISDLTGTCRSATSPSTGPAPTRRRCSS